MAFLLAICNALYAQKITGRIIDAQTQSAIPGATVKISGSNNTLISDNRGFFQLNAPAEITVSYLGYIPVTILAKNGIVVQLSPAQNPLTEVVVSAGRDIQRRKDVPAAIEKLSSITIKDTRATALYQLLNKVSGVYMVNLGNEQHTMAIRQPVTYNALYLYLEDGLPIRPTGIFNHNALYEVNMNALQNIEVLKGPASSLYGSNSIGGAINFITPPTPVSPSAKFSLQGDGYNYYRTDLSGGFSSGKTGIYAAGYAAHQENSWQDYTNFDKYSASVKASRNVSQNTRLSLTGTYNYLNTQTPGNLDSAAFYNRSYASNNRFTYRKVEALRVNARLDHSWNPQHSSSFTAFFRDNSLGQLPSYAISNTADPKTGKYKGQENELSFNSYGFLAQHKANFSFLKSQLIGGVYLDYSPSSYYANFLSIDKDANRNFYTGYTSTDSLIDNYTTRLFNTAGFFQYQIQPAEGLNITAGLRYDNVAYKFKNKLTANTKYKAQETNHFNVLAPKVGATYNLPGGLGFYGNFSLGFQPPETNSLYNSQQKTRLKQATFNNYELGGWIPMLNDKLIFEWSVYDMKGKNEIIRVLMPDNTEQSANAGATRHIGLEYTLNIHALSDWFLRISGTNAKHTYVNYSEITNSATIRYDGNRMINAPSWICNSEVAWKPKAIEGLRALIEWQHIDKYFINTSNTKTYNGYDIFNLRLGYDLKSNILKGVDVWLNALNFTDELYATTVTKSTKSINYNAAPPRTFSLGLSYHLSKNIKP